MFWLDTGEASLQVAQPQYNSTGHDQKHWLKKDVLHFGIYVCYFYATPYIMSVGFGFSVGDFIAALNLVGTIIDALREAGGAGAEYRELIRQLYTLETALLRIKRLDLEEVQNVERIALQQAASQCQRTIDNFWEKIQKYQPHLGQSGFRIKSAWSKVKWATCEKEDLLRFKTDVMAHTASIELLLMTVQM